MAETWVINESPTITSDFLAYIDFVSNQETFSKFAIAIQTGITYNGNIVCGKLPFGYSWLDQEYRTVTFETTPTGDLLTWLQANAEKQEQPSGKTLTVTYNGIDIIDSAEVSGDVAVTYDNRTIVTVSDGTKTLKCNGKVMKSDVALGGKTLKCSGKRMLSDVVVKVEPSGYKVYLAYDPQNWDEGAPDFRYLRLKLSERPNNNDDFDAEYFNPISPMPLWEYLVGTASKVYIWVTGLTASSGDKYRIFKNDSQTPTSTFNLSSANIGYQNAIEITIDSKTCIQYYPVHDYD